MPAGLAIVLTHNIWAADWRVLITLFGWLNVIGGALRLFAPPLLMKTGTRHAEAASFHSRSPPRSGSWLGSLFCFFGFRH